MQKIIENLSLLSISLLIAVLVGEGVLRLSNWDLMALRPVLFYQMADLGVYQKSENPNLIYEMRPGASTLIEGLDAVHDLEPKYKKRIVRINNLGFRDRERSWTKPEKVFRIVIVGSSNTYGALVNLEDSYPAQLESLLNQDYPGKFEVWNNGVCAYVVSQKVELARQLELKADPDLVLIEDSHQGRRAFLRGQDYLSAIQNNRELYLENIPMTQDSTEKQWQRHLKSLKLSRIYGLFWIGLNNYRVEKAFPPMDPKIGILMPSKVQNDGKLASYFHKTANEISELHFKSYLKERNSKIDLLVFDPKSRWNCRGDRDYHGADLMSLCPENKGKEYNRTHPPSYVYTWYARELKEALLKRKSVQTFLKLN